jgi:hypothetical protein
MLFVLKLLRLSKSFRGSLRWNHSSMISQSSKRKLLLWRISKNMQRTTERERLLSCGLSLRLWKISRKLRPKYLPFRTRKYLIHTFKKSNRKILNLTKVDPLMQIKLLLIVSKHLRIWRVTYRNSWMQMILTTWYKMLN